MNKNNGFWYDVFHPKNSINWWCLIYFISFILTAVLIIGSLVSFVNGYWYYGIVGILLSILGIRIILVSMDRESEY